MSKGRKRERRVLELEQQWRENFGAYLEMNIKESSFQACKRNNFSSIKSELLCELH
jgi:hypothetical protein